MYKIVPLKTWYSAVNATETHVFPHIRLLLQFATCYLWQNFFVVSTLSHVEAQVMQVNAWHTGNVSQLSLEDTHWYGEITETAQLNFVRLLVMFKWEDYSHFFFEYILQHTLVDIICGVVGMVELNFMYPASFCLSHISKFEIKFKLCYSCYSSNSF